MPPILALLLYFILLFALFRFDPARDSKLSWALWLPLTWMFFLGSRLPSQWFGLTGTSAAEAYQEGNLFDRVFFSILIMAALGVLFSRSFRLGDFVTRNIALTFFLTYALMSAFWSDYPLISMKRWIRDLGNYLMILVALSDPRPTQAFQSLLRRLFYLLIPLSIVLIKYYPELGRGFSSWTGEASNIGVTTGKNLLGMLCLICGLFFFWTTLTTWGNPSEPRRKSNLLINMAFLGMALWLLSLAGSATSNLCLGLGCSVIAAAHGGLFKRHPAILKTIVPTALCLYLILEFGFDINDWIARAVGRDPTLTDRTYLWSFLLSMRTNPLFGVGYESFWLGPRLEQIWAEFSFRPNQAHNGYIEVYLNLGLMGLFLLGLFLTTMYRNICKKLNTAYGFGSLGLALWVVLLFYNATEAAFKSHLMWLTLLLVAVSVPNCPDESYEANPVPSGNSGGFGGANQVHLRRPET